MKKIVTLFFILFSMVSFTQNGVNKIDSIVNSKLAENDPGLMVGIVKDGDIIYENYRGLANLQHQVKISEKTRTNIASTAKQFTALMVLDLVLNEKLNLEDDIRKYLPNLYKTVEDKIRIRQVLNHTSGIRDYCDLMSIQNTTWWKQVGLDNNDVIELLEKQEDLAFTPGSQYTYSNSGYNVLAKIIEKVSGKKFTAYSKQFFTDLGMNKTSFVERYMEVTPNRAEAYSDWGYGSWFQSPTVTKTAGEGFLYTTLKDQLLYEQAIQNAISNNNTLLIKSQQPILNSEIKTYGFGLMLEDLLNRDAVHHDGATSGYNSQTIRFPKEKLSILVMSNNGNINSKTIAYQIANSLLPKINKNEKYDSGFYEESRKSNNRKVVGQYRYPNGETLVRIVKKGDKTYWKEGDYFNLEMISEDANTFSFANNPKLKVVFYEDKMVEFYPSGSKKIYNRSLTAAASFNDLESLVGKYFSSELEMNFELRLTSDNKLKILFSNQSKERDVEVLNKNELLSSDFSLKVQRDQFDRVIDILLTFSRAKNNRFKKKTNLKFQPKINIVNGSIQVTNIGNGNGYATDILLTKNYPNGNEIWSKQFGGKGYDKASSILAIEDGYLIIGSTSSYGKGNYDVFAIKVDENGDKIWQNTYGDFYNEYGYTAEKTDTGYLIKGTIQNCTSNTDVFNRTCKTNVWFVSIDKNGKELSAKVLEEIK